MVLLMRKPIFTILLLIVALCSHIYVYAQLQVQPTIGEAFCYVAKKNISADFSTATKPNAGIFIHVPIVDRLQLQTGAMFMQTGYSSQSTEKSVRAKTVYSITNTINYFSVPLLLSYQVCKHKQFQYWVDAGINYNFFINGNTHYNITDYLNDVRTGTNSFSRPINAPLVRQYTDPNAGRDDLTGLDLAFKLQFHVVCNKHYSFGLYWENGLYSILANPADASSITLHSVGISIGYLIL